MLLEIIIGVIVGALGVYFISRKKIIELENEIDSVSLLLSDTQGKLKSTRSQLYRKRTTYRKKNGNTNGKKTSRKTSTKSKKARVKKAI